MARSKSPSWSKPAKEKLAEINSEYEVNVRRIALRLARHSKSTFVDEQHVMEARSSLSRLGLSQRSIWQRPEAEVGLGVTILSGTLSIHDLVELVPWIKNENQIFATWAGIVVCLILGIFFILHGWNRGRE